MALMTTPTRDSFFDPPPDDQSAATLILGNERLECRLVEVSLGGFGVSVPRSTAWTGEPTARLLTHDAAYPVRIIKQESQYTGYHFTLQRLELDESSLDGQLGLTQQWIVHASRCCAVGLIAATAYCFVVAPGGSSKDARRVQPLDVINYWTWSWQSTGWWTSRRDPATSKSHGRSLATADSESSDDMIEMPAISVSLTADNRGTNVSRPSLSSPPMTTNFSNRSMPVDPQAQAIAAATRLAQLKFSLQTARRGPRWPANSASLSWLFPTTDPAFHGGNAYFMSEAARNDLTLFESGLKTLPVTTANEATGSLRRALHATTSASASSANFEILPDVRLIRSEDAEIYFRLANGAVEILRVVPRDGSDSGGPARASSPTSSRVPQSVNR